MVRRREFYDGLTPVNEPRWLVVRDRYSRAVESRMLKPKADLRKVMTAERDRRIADGWNCQPIPTKCGFFFCDREGERVCVSIEAFEPGTAPMR